ncbi:MAG: hypothetical protein HDT29_04045 [Clostridiales bacterium]|nr:hypothetical protein [Clostridiales bacterium]
MKNKKIVVCLLIAVMVLGFTLTALVGCSGYKNIKESKLEDHLDFLATVVENTAKDKNLNNLNMGADLNIEATSGKSTKKYSIKFAAGLALASNSAAAGNTATLEIKDVTTKDSEKNIISAYYYEETGKDVYLKLGDTRFKLNGVAVREILKKNNAYLGDTASEGIADSVVSGVTDVLSYLQLISQFDGAKVQVARNGKAYRLSINLGNLLNGLINDPTDETIKTMIATYLPALGLDLTAEDLATILPALNLNIDIKLSSKKEDAVITGLSAELSCAKGEVKINKKAEGKSPLLELVIKDDLKVKADLDFKFGDDVVFATDTWTAYPDAIGAINISANGTFELKNAIENVNIMGFLNLNIPKDTYNLLVELKADPAKLVDMDFTGIHCTPHAVYEVINALDGALDLLNLNITKKDSSAFLQIKLEKVNGHVAVTALALDAIIPPSSELYGIVNMVTGALNSGSYLTILELWPMIGGMAFNVNDIDVDAGYVLNKTATDIEKGKFVYAVDTNAGYVDENKDGEPDKDENGNFVVSKDYILTNGRPEHKAISNGYVYDEENSKWVVATEYGFVDKNGDDIPDVDRNGNYVVDDDHALFQGYVLNEKGEYQKLDRAIPAPKDYLGYKKNDEGKWVVDTENGYVKESERREVVAFDDNGNFVVAEDFVLAPVEDDMILRPVKEADLNEDQQAYVDAQKKEDGALLPEVVTDIINALSISIKDGAVVVKVEGLSFVVNQDAFDKGTDTELKKISIGATIKLTATGIEISADLGGLDKVDINGTPLGLPAELGVGITFNFSSIKYGVL